MLSFLLYTLLYHTSGLCPLPGLKPFGPGPWKWWASTHVCTHIPTCASRAQAQARALQLHEHRTQIPITHAKPSLLAPTPADLQRQKGWETLPYTLSNEGPVFYSNIRFSLWPPILQSGNSVSLGLCKAMDKRFYRSHQQVPAVIRSLGTALVIMRPLFFFFLLLQVLFSLQGR